MFTHRWKSALSMGVACAAIVTACSLANAPDDPVDPGSGGSTTVSTGGAGVGGTGCDPAQCPGQDDTCSYRACVGGMCDMAFAPAGTACNEDGGTACDGMGACVAKLGNGEPCSAPADCASGQCVDGVCCDTVCDGVCEACNLPVVTGTCSPHPLGTDPDNECGGLNCDGVSACLKDLGDACGAATECASGNCVDGVCCDTMCGGLCQACTASKTGGQDGTCGPVTAGTDPDNECAGPQNCNGGGMCGCPVANGMSSIGGPLVAYGYCWYLTTPGGTCDAACNGLGGTNLAVQVQNLWGNTCSGPSAADIVTMFFNQGNPGGWSGIGTSTACHSLGYGYTNSVYYGKCTTGTVNTCGAYPNETNSSTTRTTVCACFPG